MQHKRDNRINQKYESNHSFLLRTQDSGLRTSAGFTFVETLVAIAVLLLAVAAPLSLASQGLAAARVARNQVTALYLMQETIEYVRSVRDTNRLQNRSWLLGFTSCMAGKTCTIDVPRGTVAQCIGACQQLRYDATTHLYGYTSSWSQTAFRRTVSITETIASQEALVTSSVSWSDGTLTRTVSVNERLFNWQ